MTEIWCWSLIAWGEYIMTQNFHERCYSALAKVPKGKVTTYREIAKYLGSKGYRAVGNAMNRNPNAPKVPCHRVVRSDGSLGGYAGGIKAKIRLLRREGVAIDGERVSNFDKYLYRFGKR
jgi:methylated-DNA-[protein]-cysteine S-methyltransferase